METKNLRLTPEMLEKLKASKTLGFQVEASFPYVPKFFREEKNGIPKELWTVYKLKSKDGLEVAGVEDNMYMTTDLKTKENKTFFKSGNLRIETLKKGILSVKRFLFEDGKSLDYDNTTKKMVICDICQVGNIKPAAQGLIK